MKPRKPNRNTPVLIAVTFCAVMCASNSTAADRTWSGLGGDSNWTTASNWDAAVVANDVLIFAGTTQTSNVNNFPYNTTFNGLKIAAGAGSFTATQASYATTSPATANNILIAGNIENNSSNNQDFSGINFNIQSNRTIHVNESTTLTLGDIYSNSSNTARTHTKTGLGTLVLTADGTNGAARLSGDYSHYIVSAGTMQLDANSTQNRQTVDSVTINNGGTLRFGNGVTNPSQAWIGFLQSNAIVNAGGTFDLNGHTGKGTRVQVLRSTDSGGVVTNTSMNFASLCIMSRSAVTETFGGVINDGSAGGTTGVEINSGGANAGGGTAGRVNTFTGANSYTAETLIADQTLVINGNQANATGQTFVRSYVNARLGGIGTIGGDVTVGGKLAPGDINTTNGELTGKLTINGNLTFSPDVNFTKYSDAASTTGTRIQDYNFNLTNWGAGLTAGTDHDLVVAKAITINSTNDHKLTVNVTFSGAGITNFTDTEQFITVATTTDGVTGLINGDTATRNWAVNVSGVAAAGAWTVETSGDGKNLLLHYTPATPTADVVWDGGGADDNFSTALNWSGDVAPASAQSVGFAGSTRLTPFNDQGGSTPFDLSTNLTDFDAIATVADTTGIVPGTAVSGTGIPVGTTVLSVDSATQITLSNLAEGTQTSLLTYTPPPSFPQVNGILFYPGASSFTLTGNPLNLGDTTAQQLRVINDGTNLQTIALDLQVRSGTNQIWARNGNILHTGKLYATASRKVTSLGTNTTTLAGTQDNAFLDVDALEGTLILAKDSSPTVHAANRVLTTAASLGTVKLAGTGGDQIAGNVILDGGTLDLNGTNESINQLTSSATTGIITNNAASTVSTLTVTNPNGGYNGKINDGAGQVKLVATSTTNTQIQLVAPSNYTGGTVINGAKIRIQTDLSVGTGLVTFTGNDPAAKSTLFVPSSGYVSTTGSMNNNLHVASGDVGKIRWGRSITVPGYLTGAGTLHVSHENRDTQGTTVTGDWSAFTGRVIYRPGDSSTPTANITNLTLSNPSGLPSAVLTLQTDYIPSPEVAGTNGDLRYGGPANATIPIGDLNTDGNADVAALRVYNNTAGTTTFEVGGLGLSSSLDALVMDGNASSITAITKTGAGTWTLVDPANSYTGQTAVNGGTLSVAHNLADAAPVRVASGAVLNLATAGTDVVDSLWLNGSQVPAGTYGPIGSGATHKSAHFTGAGILSVTNGPLLSGYSTWASSNAGAQTSSEDFDLDGVSNGVEYFMGLTGSSFTANPGLVSGTVTWTNGGNIPNGEYGTQFVVQTSSNLVTWTDVLAGDPNLVNSAGSVSYTPPAGAGKSFVRLKVKPD